MVEPHKQIAHFIGIGGIGMSALARWFLAQNWAVYGSDMAKSAITRELTKEGVKVKIGHKKANLPKEAVMVIYNAAIRTSNPELREARRRGLRPMSYPEVIGCLTKVYKTIGITGSHGKSTTTAMLGLMLLHAGLDPTIVVGTKLAELGNRNFRFGKSKWFVLEADDYKAAFLNYFPLVTIATTLDREHLEVYGTLENIKKAFIKFFGNTKRGGVLIVNRDDKNMRALRSPIQKLVKRKNLRLFWYSIHSKNTRDDAQQIRKVMHVPGQHNVSNALAAYLAGTKVLGVKKHVALKALGAYHGAWRRMEYKGQFKIPASAQWLRTGRQNSKFKIPVYDDYAHHPTEIKATLAAFREKFPKHRIVCVFQPHQGKRLHSLFPEFVTAFKDAGFLVVLPLYRVAGRDQTYRNHTAEKLTAAISKKYPKKEVIYLANPKKIATAIRSLLPSIPHPLSFMIIMMGAGDIADYTPLLTRRKRLESR